MTRTAADTGTEDPAVLTVLAWALVHGLVDLTHNGALRDSADPTTAGRVLAHRAVAALDGLITGHR